MCKRIFASQTSESGDVPFYKIGTIGGQADAYISYELFNQYRSRYHFPNQGETLITCSGTVGRCIQYDGRPAYFQDSNIVWLHGDRSPITSNFLFRLLSKRNWKTLNTTTISRIYSSDLLGLRLFYPPIVEEQERISDFLSLLDQRIEVQNKIIEEKKREIIVLNDELYSHAIKTIHGFADIADNYSGLSGKNSEDFGKGASYITYLNVLNNRYIDKSSCGYVTIHKNEKQNTVLYGDVILTLSSETPEEVGVSSVYLGNDTLYLNSFCFGIRFKTEETVLPEYATWLFSTTAFRKHIYPFAQGSTRYNLNLGSFMKSSFAFPSVDDQRRFAGLLNRLEESTKLEIKMLDELKLAKSFLLQQLFI